MPYPQMPNPDDPGPVAWAAIARAELGMLKAGGGHTAVIAHSLGTILWTHIAETLPAQLLPSRIALVAPPSRHEWAVAAPKFADIALGSLSTATTVIVGRAEDPARNVPLAQLADAWGAPSVEIPGSGHLTPDDGYGPFPGALGWVLGWVLGGRDESWAQTTSDVGH